MSPLLVAGACCLGLAAFLVIAGLAGATRGVSGVERSLVVLDALTRAANGPAGPGGAEGGGLDSPLLDRVLIPLLNRAQGLGRRMTPQDAAERLRAKLDLAGNPHGWSVERVGAAKVVGFVAALVLSLLVALTLGLGFLPTLGFVVVASMAGYCAPNLYLYQRAYDRAAMLQRDLPDAIDLLTISVEAGLGFDAAVAQVARNTEGPLAEELARLLQEMQIGLGRADALRSLADRTNLPDLRAFVSAMVQADSFGIPVGQVLRTQSTEIRLKKRQWAEEMAQKVPVKILVPLIFTILPALFIVVLGPAAISIMANFSGTISP